MTTQIAYFCIKIFSQDFLREIKGSRCKFNGSQLPFSRRDIKAGKFLLAGCAAYFIFRGNLRKMQRPFLVLSLSLAAFAVFAENGNSQGRILEGGTTPEEKDGGKKGEEGGILRGYSRQGGNLTRRERSGRSKGILLVPTKEMVKIMEKGRNLK